jgi:hypothetical protein
LPRTAAPARGGIALAALLVALAAAPATAQLPAPAPTEVPKRGGGLWVDVGAGLGWLRLTSGQNLINGQEIRGVTAAHGMAVTATVGGAPSANVLLGVQVQEWRSSGSGVRQRVRSLLAVVQWYPWPGMGFFVRAGTGVVQGPVEAPDTTTNAQAGTASGMGVGFALGIGYDFPMSRHLGLTVQAATHIAALGDLTRNGQTANDVIAYVTRIGVAVVYR